MKIMLINPFWFESDTFDILISSNPPLGLAYISSYLEKNGYKDIEILDMKLKGANNIEDKIIEIQPDIIGISITTGQVSSASKIVKTTKKVKPDAITVIGGYHSSALPERTLRETNADICVIGEGEVTFLEVVKVIEKKGSLNHIKGICFKKNNKIITNDKRELIENIDELPLPSRHLLPSFKKYGNSSSFGEDKCHASVMASRGCPFNCKFCDKSVFGRIHRTRSIGNVVDEIEMLVKQGVEEIRFFDDLFTSSEKRVDGMCREIIKRNLKFSWCCEARINSITREMLKSMKRAGCYQIHYGIESGSQRILDILNKQTNLNKIREVVKITKEEGIKIKAYFLLGLPGETKEDIEKTINFAKSIDIDYAAFYLYAPYPGTELYKSLNKYGNIIATKWEEYLTYETPAFLPNGISKKELESLYKKAFRKFYFRPKYMLKIIKEIKSFSILLSYIKAGMWAIIRKRPST